MEMAAKVAEKGWQVKRIKKQTFDEFFTAIYLPHAKARKKSWRLDECMERCHISSIFGHMRLAEISSFDVELWLTRLREKGLAASTCNRILALFKSVCTLAEKYGQIPSGMSPSREVRKLKAPPAQARYLSVEEGKKLMAYLRGIDKTEARVIELLLLTGARRSEILQARWENLDLEHRILTVPLSKSGRTRHIYLSAEAAGIFAKMRGLSTGYIFPGRNADRPASTLYQFWRKTRDTLGLTGTRVHDLRHTYASYLVSGGHSLYETQQLLGHSDPRTTMRYAHFAQEKLLAAAEDVMKILGKAVDNKPEMILPCGNTRRRHLPKARVASRRDGRATRGGSKSGGGYPRPRYCKILSVGV